MKAAFVLAALFVSSLAYAGEPHITVGDIKPQHVRRPELFRAAERYGEPKITIGNEKPVRRPELSRWFLWLRSL